MEDGGVEDARKKMGDMTIPDFPNLTPMLVMPFRQFVAQGCDADRHRHEHDASEAA